MPKVQLKSALSSLREPGDIADDLIAQLGGSEIPRLVTVFSSLPCDNAALNRAIRERLPEDTRIIGATTAGEIDRDGYHRKTVQMCSLSGDFEVGVGLGRGLSKDAMGAGLVAVAHACRELGIMPTDLDPRSNVGVVIDDGSQNKKEELLLGMMERNQSMTLVGGGAMAQGIEQCRKAALDFTAWLGSTPDFVPLFTPELDIVVWTVRSATASEASQKAKDFFDRAAQHDIHLALASFPQAMVEPCGAIGEWDTSHVTCLRSCLMKPEHLTWLPQIIERLEQARVVAGVSGMHSQELMRK